MSGVAKESLSRVVLSSLSVAKAFLNAHENVVAWAQGKGFSVPQQVVDAIASGAERAQVLQKFEAIP